MEVNENEVYVARTFYDENWNSFYGSSKIGGSDITINNYGVGVACGGSVMKYNNEREIGIGDKVSYNNKVYTVLINYIKDDTDRKGFTPTENWTVLIDDNGDRETVYNHNELTLIQSINFFNPS